MESASFPGPLHWFAVIMTPIVWLLSVSTDAVVDNLLARLPSERHELVLFDVNRSSVTSTILTSDPGPLTRQLLEDESLPFALTLLTNVVHQVIDALQGAPHADRPGDRRAMDVQYLFDLVDQFAGSGAYTFVFDGQWGYLDYGMASGSLQKAVTGTTVWHLNADEPDLLDYDTSFKSDGQIAIFDGTSPFRSSDHDPVIVGIRLDSN